MKIEKLYYFDTYEIFQGLKRFKKIGFKASFDDEVESVRDVYYKLQRTSEELFYESKGAAEKQMGTQVVDIPENLVSQEWEDIKRHLLSFDNAEAAQLYLNSTSYSMTIEAKQIINTLKNKNEKK